MAGRLERRSDQNIVRLYLENKSDPIAGIGNFLSMTINTLAVAVGSTRSRGRVPDNLQTLANSSSVVMNNYNDALSRVAALVPVENFTTFSTDLVTFVSQISSLLDNFQSVFRATMDFLNENAWNVLAVTDSTDLRQAILKAQKSTDQDAQASADLLNTYLNAVSSTYPGIFSGTKNYDVTSKVALHDTMFRISELVDFLPNSKVQASADQAIDPAQFLTSDPSSLFSYVNSYAETPTLSTIYTYWSSSKKVLYVMFERSVGVGVTVVIAQLPIGAYRVKRHPIPASPTGTVQAFDIDGVAFITSSALPLSATGDQNRYVINLPPLYIGNQNNNNELILFVQNPGYQLSITGVGSTGNVESGWSIEPLNDFENIRPVSDFVGGYDGLPAELAVRSIFKYVGEYLLSNPDHPFFVRMDKIYSKHASGFDTAFILQNGNTSRDQCPKDYTLFSVDYKDALIFGADMWFNECPGSDTVYPISPANLKTIYPYYVYEAMNVVREMNYSYNSADIDLS